MRSKATDSGHRLGSIVVNPGGPGSAAFDLVVASYLSERLRAQFDIVAMDPRGVGESTPINCPAAWAGKTLLPQTEADFNQMAQANAAYYRACKQATGALIDHVDTVSVARDLDAVRKALGDERLTFAGFSYGTAVAQTYARFFPNRVRALLLDGVLDYQQPAATFVKTEVDAAEDSLVRFAARCQSDSSCALYGQDPLMAFDQVVSKANLGQVLKQGSAINGEVVTGGAGDFLLMAGDFVSKESGWAALANAIKQAQSGDGTEIAGDFDFYQGVQRAISCLDKPVSISNWTDYQTIRSAAQSPHLGGNVQTLQTTTACIGWGAPAPAVPVIQPGLVNGSRMLLVTSTHDPSTPASWAQNVQSRLPGSALVYREGDGHTSYQYSACIRKYADDFLITGTLPANGGRCAS